MRVWDRTLRGVRTFASADCRFGYRTSRFKADPARHVVLSVTFQLRQGDLGAPVAYAELARALGVELGERAPLADVRRGRAGAARRQGHGARPDRPRHLERRVVLHQPGGRRRRRCPTARPAWPQPDGRVKTSAAWLIEHAGFAKGYGTGTVALSGKHTLALTNRGGATTDELLALAREVRDGVAERFGIVLVNEPVLVGCEL